MAKKALFIYNFNVFSLFSILKIGDHLNYFNFTILINSK